MVWDFFITISGLTSAKGKKLPEKKDFICKNTVGVFLAKKRDISKISYNQKPAKAMLRLVLIIVNVKSIKLGDGQLFKFFNRVFKNII